MRNPDRDGPWALREIDLEVRRGETLGIIGRNGAGKSTLLKVLAGVTPPTRGQVEVGGRVFPMIELNAGVHPELTGRENVRLLGAVMGVNRTEIEAKMPKIEAFCELGDWFDRPARQYSSGMLARLGFGVAMNVDADVLLVDEVLAVGDLAFQQRCYDRIDQSRKDGTTVILVSHNIRQVARLCEPVILLEEGRIAESGSAGEVTSLYYERCSDIAMAWNKSSSASGNPIIQATGDVLIKSVTISDEAGRPAERLGVGQSVTFRLEFIASRRIENPVVGLEILTSDMLVLAGVNTDKFNLEGQGWIECTIPELPLLPGIYAVTANVKQRNGARLFKGMNLARFSVLPGDRRGSWLNYTGMIALNCRWDMLDSI
jgi:ABC-type polysaccharide/polyol phosphate transport system ATPase subunit